MLWFFHAYHARPARLPSIRLGRPLSLPEPSNAGLFEWLDE
jgi:hypothetical protein